MFCNNLCNGSSSSDLSSSWTDVCDPNLCIDDLTCPNVLMGIGSSSYSITLSSSSSNIELSLGYYRCSGGTYLARLPEYSIKSGPGGTCSNNIDNSFGVPFFSSSG